MATASVLDAGRNFFFFFFLRDNILDLAKKVLPPLESKLLVLCESTGNTLKIVYNVL
jgi:hypothetical protein